MAEGNSFRSKPHLPGSHYQNTASYTRSKRIHAIPQKHFPPKLDQPAISVRDSAPRKPKMNSTRPIMEVYYKEKCWSLVPGGIDARSYFGGPHSVHVESLVELESAVVHHIATINLPKFGVGSPRFGFTLPLFYGICHEGCEIEYRKTATAAVEFTSLDPEEADEGYPYHGYPPQRFHRRLKAI
jgi:hypothetical protein